MGCMQVANERTPVDIQREIEQARGQLASSLDQLAERTNPKRLATQAKQSAIEKASSPQGKKIIAGAAAVIVFILVLARVRSARSK